MLGFLLIDKPSGITSFRIVAVLRKLLNLRRIGYAGTLDPLATGLMIVAIGEATKFLPFLEKMDKAYEVKIRFGVTSTTYDREGQMTEVPIPKTFSIPERSDLEVLLKKHFFGERLQRPPAFSAIQVGGKRAYDLARKGLEVDLKERRVHFFDLKILDFSWPFLSVRIHCSSGTYIRSFAHDLGQILGVGGYVEELRRTNIGSYQVAQSVPLDQLTSENISPHLLKPQAFLKEWSTLELTNEEYEVLAHGGYVQQILSLDQRPFLALFQGQAVGILEEVHPTKISKRDRIFFPQPVDSGSLSHPVVTLKFAKKFTII